MPLTVLGDKEVNRILHSFGKEDILQLQESLADALHWYSTSSDANDCCSNFQPERTHLKRKDGSTTLYMPASTIDSQGVKVINIVPSDNAAGLPSLDNLSLDSTDSHRSSLSGTSTSSPRNSISAASNLSTTTTSSSSQVSDLKSSNASVSSMATGQTSISSQQLESKPAFSAIKGSLTLMDNSGHTTGILNAEEITAFRTALASTMLLKKRNSVHDLTVFGAGKQAYWHMRLALILRGDEIHHLNIVTRSFDSARECIMRLYNPQPDDPTYVNPIGEKYNSKTKKNILTPMHTEYGRLVKEFVRSSNVIFCCTPSSTPLFPASYLTNPSGRNKGRYIACIGSYKPSMIELHPEILRYAVAPHHEHRHIHKRQKEGGAIIVDTVTGALKEAGEIVQAKIMPDQVVELGELFMLKRDAERKMREQGQQVESGCTLQEDSGLKEWLTKGNVIYKSVGLGLMDVTVGQELIRIARERSFGVTVEDF